MYVLFFLRRIPDAHPNGDGKKETKLRLPIMVPSDR